MSHLPSASPVAVKGGTAHQAGTGCASLQLDSNPRPLTPSYRVLIVESDDVFRHEIIQTIEREPDLFCCGQGDDVLTTPALVATYKPHLILVEAHPGKPADLRILSLLTLAHREVPILVISKEPEFMYAEKALQAGAKGFLMKCNVASELVSAARALLQGKVYLSHAMSIRLVSRILQGENTSGQASISDGGGK